MARADLGGQVQLVVDEDRACELGAGVDSRSVVHQIESHGGNLFLKITTSA